MSRATNFGRAARFESLEQRQLLAGDVLVNVVRGNLVIEGDAEGNEIAVTAGVERGAFLVTGLNGTTVHQDGQTPASEVTITGVRRDQIVPGLWHRTKQEKFGSPVVGHATKLKMLASACFSYVRFAVARVVQPAG